jgi:hypothetical protein
MILMEAKENPGHKIPRQSCYLSSDFNRRLWNQPVADFVDLPVAIELSGAAS